MHKGHGISITLKKNPMLMALSLELAPTLLSVQLG